MKESIIAIIEFIKLRNPANLLVCEGIWVFKVVSAKQHLKKVRNKL